MKTIFGSKLVASTLVKTVDITRGDWIKELNLREAIRKQLGKEYYEEIESSEVETMNGLSAANLNIETLEGLEKFNTINGIQKVTQVTDWNLRNNQLKYIEGS